MISAAPFSQTIKVGGVPLIVDIFFRSESKGISERGGNFFPKFSFQIPALAAALRMAPSVGSPMTFQAVLSFLRQALLHNTPIPRTNFNILWSISVRSTLLVVKF